MFLENKSRKFESFEVDLEGSDDTDSEAYSELLSNPLINILDKKWVKRRTENWDGYGNEKSGTVKETWYMSVEYEARSL
jgi:hypothetical protein